MTFLKQIWRLTPDSFNSRLQFGYKQASSVRPKKHEMSIILTGLILQDCCQRQVALVAKNIQSKKCNHVAQKELIVLGLSLTSESNTQNFQ